MKKFQALMKSRFENTKKDNKGFSLVELIIAVVILGIIAVVAIGGLYSNVTKARINTDVSNARDIQSALSTLSADKDVFAWAKKQASDTGITIEWSAATANTSGGELGATATVTGDTTEKLFSKKIAAILTDGLPAPKAATKFTLTIKPETKDSKTTGTGTVIIKCEAKNGDTVLTEAE